MNERPRKLLALTGLRFVAAAGIVVTHSGWFGVGAVTLAYTSFNLGLFVSLFFILSGFILAYSYPRLESTRERGRFLLARFGRIWPAHAMALLMMAILFKDAVRPVSSIGSPTLAIFNLGMLHSWIPIQNVVFSFNSPSWSIATEFGFYLIYPILIYRWRQNWWIKLLVTCLIPIALQVACHLFKMPSGDASGSMIDAGFVYFNCPTNLWQFALGMSAALAWQSLAPRLQVGKVSGTLVEFGCVGLAVASMYYPVILTLFGWCDNWGILSTYNFARFIVAMPFALLIVVLAYEMGFVARILGSRPFVLLGEISYTIYILHFVLIRLYREYHQIFAGLPVVVVYAVFWLILLAFCSIVYVCWEKPMRKWLVGLWPNGDRSMTRSSAALQGRVAVWISSWLTGRFTRLLRKGASS